MPNPAARKSRSLSTMALVERIYSAAVNDGGDRNLAHEIVELFGGAGILGTGDLEFDSFKGLYYGVTEKQNESYFSDWRHRDILAKRAMIMAPRSAATTAEDLMSPGALGKCEIYNEFYRPCGFGRILTGYYDAGRHHYGFVVFFRGLRDAAFSHEDKLIAGQIVRHLGQANTILQRIALAERAGGSPVALLDSKCRLVHASRSAEKILARDNRFSVRDGRLGLREPELNERLSAAVSRASSNPGNTVSIRISPPRGTARPLALEICSLPPSLTLPLTAGEVLVTFLSARAQPHPELLRERFGLTHMEAQVALAVANSNGLSEAAARLGISRNTAHTHIKRVFEKANVHRQSELVGLLHDL